MRSVQTDASAHGHRSRGAVASPACLATVGTAAGSEFCACPSITLPLSCTPWLHGSYPASQLLWVLRLLPARPCGQLDHGQVSLIHAPELPTIPPPNTRYAPDIALTRYPSAVRLPVTGLSTLLGLGFAIVAQARRHARPNRIHDGVPTARRHCGLVIHLRLLSTPPRDDAVIFGYGPENVCPKGTCTLLIWYTLRRTRRRKRQHRH